MMDSINNPDLNYMLPWTPPAGRAEGDALWQNGEGPSFDEFLDIINPLQHIPIVSSIYRAVTGDEIGLGARLAGGAIFGGGFGVVATGLTAAAEEALGTDMGEQIASLFGGGDSENADPAAGAGQNLAAIEETPLAAPVPPAPARIQTGPARVGPPVDLRPQQLAQALDDGRAESNPVRAQISAQGVEAQRLLARIAVEAVASSRPKEQPAPAAQPAPARARHPLMPPPGATPDWYLKAMDRAFRKYRGAPAANEGASPQPEARSAFAAPARAL